ncbi:hypothetical protein Q5V23_003507 [Vibrio fluvialis]|nr:hypothetical protein [Vibrio fluvialis]
MAGLSLKAKNIVPLSVLVVFQLIAISVVNRQTFDTSLLDILKDTGGAMLVISVLAGWLSHLIPADLKNSLVFLRWRNVLPGHRFIQLAEKDTRIDIDLFKTRVADYESLKSDNKNQNSYWYREFYRPVTNQDEVASTHKSYLLYRDAAAVSLISAVILVLTKLLIDIQMAQIGFNSVWVFAIAIIGFIVAARNAGQRMVTTAIAVRLTTTVTE